MRDYASTPKAEGGAVAQASRGGLMPPSLQSSSPKAKLRGAKAPLC